MADTSAPSLTEAAFLGVVYGFPCRACMARRTTRHRFRYRAASPGAVISVPACTAQVTYRLIIGP
jgi:hypothetical protein